MEYNKIIAVTGLPGLYELLSSKSDGAIVRSLDDKTTRFVSSRVHNFSHLESIEVYTVRDNVNLVDILKAMESSPEKQPDEKDAAELKAYFSKVFPDLDFGRVYSSDLKKMVKWYAVLKANNIEIKLSEEALEEEEPEEDVKVVKEKAAPATNKKAEKAAPAVKEEKEAKAVTAKKDAPVAEKTKAEKTPAKKPVVATAAKAKTEKAPAKKTAASEKATDKGKGNAKDKGKTDKKVAPASDKSKKAGKKKS